MGGHLTVTASCWRSVVASTAGSSHRAVGDTCEDASAVRHLDDGRVVVAVADGAGSAARAAEGSAAAVVAAVDALCAGTAIDEAFDAAARSLGDDPADRATTLLVAVFDGDVLTVGQVGDGFVVVRRDGAYDVVGEPVEREYLNVTVFLSSPSWRDHLEVTTLDATAIDAVALLTDGLQLVAIELASSTPFAGFFDPLFAWVGGGDASDGELAEFLASPRLAGRTDDDLTLALLLRAP